MSRRGPLRLLTSAAPLLVSASAGVLAVALCATPRRRRVTQLPRRSVRSGKPSTQDGILPLTARSVTLTGRRFQHNDALASFATDHHFVCLLIDGVGDRPSAAAAGIHGATGAVLAADDRSASELALDAICAADSAYRGALAVRGYSDASPRPAAAAAVAVVDLSTGEFGVAWAGDTRAFVGLADGNAIPVTRPHNLGSDPGLSASFCDSSIVTRCLGDESPSPLPPERCEDALRPGESLIVATDGVLDMVDTSVPFWWRGALDNPPDHVGCADNATLLVLEPTVPASEDDGSYTSADSSEEPSP